MDGIRAGTLGWHGEVVTAQPLVSVITATYNASASLAACLKSVQNQDYPKIEHIIVDGNSKDDTVDILKQNKTANLRWISEPDRGIYDAWNKGLAMATGEWIAFLGADDMYVDGAISAYMDLAMKHADAEYISGQVRWIAANGRPRLIGESWQWPRFQKFMCTAHVGSMHRRKLFEKYGNYDTSYRLTADYEFLLRAGGGLKTAFLPRITAQMQGGGATDSFAALDEAARAKIESGKRGTSLVAIELIYAKAKYFGRQMSSH